MELNLKGDRTSVSVTNNIWRFLIHRLRATTFPLFATVVTGKLECWLEAGGLRLGEEKGHSGILLAQDGKASDLSHSGFKTIPCKTKSLSVNSKVRK